MKIYQIILFVCSAVIIFSSCSFEKDSEPLPVLGFKKIVGDTEQQHEIPNFSFINLDILEITNAYYSDHIYVADFFFTTCPSICPIVTREMLKVYEAFEDEDMVKMLSHTLDPEYDNVQILKEYADNIDVATDKWSFVTGDKDEIYDITESYFSVVIEDDEAPGGINHSGKLLLIDKDKHIRAFCEGTDSEDVDDFIKDIKKLIREYEK